MNTITENQVQVAGTSLQVELANANAQGAPIVAVLCPADTTASASAPSYTSQLRGYSK